LNQKEKECFVRPCANFLFRSFSVKVDQALFVVLTGMGNDGLDGLEYLASKNPDILIQDQDSSVVWGMPGEVYNKKLHTEMRSLSEIKELIQNLIK
jgi:two-component system chemotaxis response regulator CheB